MLREIMVFGNIKNYRAPEREAPLNGGAETSASGRVVAGILAIDFAAS